MIQFNDPKLFAKGTCQAQACDPTTGDILFYSNKFQTGNFSTSYTAGEIRGGLGNPVAAMLGSDSTLNVEFTAADFSLWAKAAQVGAQMSYNAPHMVCETVEATSATLTATLTAGTPVARVGYSDVFCYVQEVGSTSTVATDGTAYPIDASTGVVSGFSATNGRSYKIWYFIQTASAKMATIGAMFDPKVVNFTAQIAVYRNDGASQNNGTRVGWLYLHVPYLKLGANAGITGDQTNPDTTSMSGQALAYDEATVSANCEDCTGSALAYYIYVPDDAAEEIKGIALVGGVITAAESTTVDLDGLFRFVMANGELVKPNAGDLTYTLTTTVTGCSITDNILTTGSTVGDGEITAEYGSPATYDCVANLSVVSA